MLPALLATLLLTSSIAAAAFPPRFTTEAGRFHLDGKPVVIKAAELHYPRIPRPYWEHRIRMCKALGMNAICLYVFWNAHESQPGSYDFSGNLDLREFIKLCEREGLMVILRPGPYVCAEWEMGGLPWWLLREPDMKLREDDPRFLSHVKRFEQAVAEQVADLTIDRGGPIVMVQVENEYGSYGKNKPYVAAIRDMLRRLYGEQTTLFQCDWSSNFLDNGLDDLLWTMNFGTGADIDAQFAELRRVRPESPLMCSEYWSGWFDKWGAAHETRPSADMTAGIAEMLDKGISFSLYMTHGGTNWGHWAGANSPGYAPDVTSYDYDAPINEQGSPTPKYHELRSVLARHYDEPLPQIPDTLPVMPVERFSLTEFAPLAQNLPRTVSDTLPRNMEAYNQGFGSILYATELPALSGSSTLTVDEAHDYAQVLLDGLLIGTLDRRLGQTTLQLPPVKQGARLELLVEAMGRINFGRAIADRKGIDGRVSLLTAEGREVPLRSWQVTPIEDDYRLYSAMNFVEAPEPQQGGRGERGVYRGTFNVATPADTYLNFESWGKGLVYVNGFGLGRIWEIGPQLTLFTPGCLLKEGENEVLVFDILGPRSLEVEGLTAPVIDRVRVEADTINQPIISLADKPQVAAGEFALKPGWQQVPLAAGACGRYLALEVLSTAGGEAAAIAEMQLLDARGERIPREQWMVAYVDSQHTAGANHSAEKTFDLQESTYWASAPGDTAPYTIVIDLGADCEATALQYLPRMEPGTPGAVGRYRVYMF